MEHKKREDRVHFPLCKRTTSISQHELRGIYEMCLARVDDQATFAEGVISAALH
jgi:hypothetical protein